MKYKVKTHPDTTKFTGTDIYMALDFAIEYSDKNPNINLWVYNEKEEEICIIVKMEYNQLRENSSQMKGE